MSIEDDIFNALKALVSNRVYPLTFAQPGGLLPTWPAIRYTLVDAETGATVCGDGDTDADTVRVQLDLVDKTYGAARALRLSAIAAMKTLPTPATRDSEGEEFDAATKTFRVRLDYLIHPSSLT